MSLRERKPALQITTDSRRLHRRIPDKHAYGLAGSGALANSEGPQPGCYDAEAEKGSWPLLGAALERSLQLSAQPAQPEGGHRLATRHIRVGWSGV